MSACGKYEGMYVRMYACPCVWTALTPTLAHLSILVVGCEAIHGLVLVIFDGLGHVLWFALRAITSVHTHTHTHTHTSTRTKLYMHIYMHTAPQHPLYTDTPVGLQDLVRPSLAHLGVGELEGGED
jgi:hypothetical protein